MATVFSQEGSDEIERRLLTAPAIRLIKPVYWENAKTCNPTGLGADIMKYADRWARLMQRQIDEGKAVKEVAEQTGREAGWPSIIQLVPLAAVEILVDCWEHGEALKDWYCSTGGAGCLLARQENRPALETAG